MRRIAVEVVGDTSYCVPDWEINQVIAHITSEYDGQVNVLIVCGPFRSRIGKKVVVSEEEGIVLGVYSTNFLALFEEDALNVKELIYVMDAPKISLAQLMSSFELDVWHE